MNDSVPAPQDRESAVDRVMARPLWGEDELAVVFGVTVDAVRHMKSRGEIPGVVQVIMRTWRVHRDAFLEHFLRQGMPKTQAGRPRGSQPTDMAFIVA